MATIDGQPVTDADLEKAQKELPGSVKKEESEFQNKVYEHRKQALDNYVAKRLSWYFTPYSKRDGYYYVE